MPKQQHKNPISGIAKGLLLSYCLTAAIFIIYALLLVYTSVSDIHISLIARLSTAACSAVCGMIASCGIKKNGLVTGILGGLMYTLVMLCIAFAFAKDFTISLNTAITIGIGCLSGAVGGIIGINIFK